MSADTVAKMEPQTEEYFKALTTAMGGIVQVDQTAHAGKRLPGCGRCPRTVTRMGEQRHPGGLFAAA